MIEWWFLHLRIPAREAETATRAVAACTNRVKACQFALIASVCSDCVSLVHSEVSAFRSRNFCFFAVIGGSFIPTCPLAFWCYRLAAAFSKAIGYHIAGCIFDKKTTATIVCLLSSCVVYFCAQRPAFPSATHYGA